MSINSFYWISVRKKIIRIIFQHKFAIKFKVASVLTAKIFTSKTRANFWYLLIKIILIAYTESAAAPRPTAAPWGRVQRQNNRRRPGSEPPSDAPLGRCRAFSVISYKYWKIILIYDSFHCYIRFFWNSLRNFNSTPNLSNSKIQFAYLKWCKRIVQYLKNAIPNKSNAIIITKNDRHSIIIVKDAKDFFYFLSINLS